MKRSANYSFSRRHLIQSLGAGAALTPFLPLLNASGQEAVLPKRLLLFFSPDGTAAIDDGGQSLDWEPQGTESDFALTETHAPLAELTSRIVVPYGLSMSAGGAGQEHAFGMSGLWSGARLHEPHDGASFDGGNGLRTGWGSAATIDQIVAANFGPNMPYERSADDAAPETAYRSLEFGVQCSDPDSKHRMIYRDDKQPIHPETNPKAAFDRLFSGLNLEGSAAPETSDSSSLRRQASIDHLMLETEKLRTRVGAEEYVKIDAHLEGLRAIQRRIETATPPTNSETCSVPDEPLEATSRWENSETFPDECNAMIDLAVHSLACDLTRVASIQLSRGFSNIVHEWSGHTEGHHTISHLNGDHRQELLDIDQWYAQKFAELLTALDSVPEGDGTLLDNTLVVWGREMGQTNHRMSPVNLIVAGGARGALSPGRYINVQGQKHAKLLVSIAQIMGLDIDSVGDIDPNSGPLSGLV